MSAKLSLMSLSRVIASVFIAAVMEPEIQCLRPVFEEDVVGTHVTDLILQPYKGMNHTKDMNLGGGGWIYIYMYVLNKGYMDFSYIVYIQIDCNLIITPPTSTCLMCLSLKSASPSKIHVQI